MRHQVQHEATRLAIFHQAIGVSHVNSEFPGPTLLTVLYHLSTPIKAVRLRNREASISNLLTRNSHVNEPRNNASFEDLNWNQFVMMIRNNFIA